MLGFRCPKHALALLTEPVSSAFGDPAVVAEGTFGPLAQKGVSRR